MNCGSQFRTNSEWGNGGSGKQTNPISKEDDDWGDGGTQAEKNNASHTSGCDDDWGDSGSNDDKTAGSSEEWGEDSGIDVQKNSSPQDHNDDSAPFNSENPAKSASPKRKPSVPGTPDYLMNCKPVPAGVTIFNEP